MDPVIAKFVDQLKKASANNDGASPSKIAVKDIKTAKKFKAAKKAIETGFKKRVKVDYAINVFDRADGKADKNIDLESLSEINLGEVNKILASDMPKASIWAKTTVPLAIALNKDSEIKFNPKTDLLGAPQKTKLKHKRAQYEIEVAASKKFIAKMKNMVFVHRNIKLAALKKEAKELKHRIAEEPNIKAQVKKALEANEKATKREVNTDASLERQRRNLSKSLRNGNLPKAKEKSLGSQLTRVVNALRASLRRRQSLRQEKARLKKPLEDVKKTKAKLKELRKKIKAFEELRVSRKFPGTYSLKFTKKGKKAYVSEIVEEYKGYKFGYSMETNSPSGHKFILSRLKNHIGSGQDKVSLAELFGSLNLLTKAVEDAESRL